MTARRVWAGTLSLTVAVLLNLATLLTAPAVADSNPYPVPYQFLSSAALAALPPDADPPGANDWSCRPSRAHPRPVVLMHGLLGNKATNWQTFAPLLANNGYCVYAMTYGVYPGDRFPINQVGGRRPMQASAEEFGVFVARVLKSTGADQIDLVGHSEGTMVPNYYARFLGGARYIHRYISLAPWWHGGNPLGVGTIINVGSPLQLPGLTASLSSSTCAACTQSFPGSSFIKKMQSGSGPVVPGIRYTNIVTRYDEMVIPYTNGIQAGMRNITLQDICPIDLADHLQIVADPTAAAIVLNTLDPTHPRPVPCRLQLPLLGGSD